jgi:predicted RNA-binding protein (virulence factor B family)
VEIKIGIQHSARELSLESNLSGGEVEAAVAAALKDGGLLILVDEKDRKVIVPAEKIAYVELGEPTGRRVGFGAI